MLTEWSRVKRKHTEAAAREGLLSDDIAWRLRAILPTRAARQIGPTAQKKTDQLCRTMARRDYLDDDDESSRATAKHTSVLLTSLVAAI